MAIYQRPALWVNLVNNIVLQFNEKNVNFDFEVAKATEQYLGMASHVIVVFMTLSRN